MPRRSHRPPLTVKQIIAWAKAHQRRTGRWPNAGTGPIPGAQMTWAGVNSALRNGDWGLPCGASLSKLLDEHCRVKATLTVEQILSWMKGHRQRTGRWPVSRSGAVLDAPGEDWQAIEASLRHGNRGLPAGLSLWQLRLLTGQAEPEQVERRRRTARELDLGGFLHKGHYGPWWTKSEVTLLGRVPNEEVARRTGRSTDAVRQKRQAMERRRRAGGR